MKSWLNKIYFWVSLLLTIYFVINLSPRLFNYVNMKAADFSPTKNLFTRQEDIGVLWLLGVLIAIFFIVLVIHIITKARRDKTEINLINKVLAATRDGGCRWSLDDDWDGYVLFTGNIERISLEFTPFPVGGKLEVNGCYPQIELSFSESRNLEKAIRTVGFFNKVAADRKRERLARTEQLTKVANVI